MNAAETLGLAHALGVAVSVKDGAIVCTPASRLNDECRAQIKANRIVLLALLTEPPELAQGLEELIDAALRACDHWNDGEDARQQMRQQCVDTPPELRQELMTHFVTSYGGISQ